MYGAGAAWSRLFLPGAGAGADPSRSEPEPESAPGPWRPGAGAAQKSGGSATLFNTVLNMAGQDNKRNKTLSGATGSEVGMTRGQSVNYYPNKQQ